MFKKIFKLIVSHKIIAGIIVLALAGAGYYGYAKLNGGASQTRYVLAAVQKGTLITSISGSGQVSASNQVDIKPKASGDIVYLGAGVGQEVKAGALLAQLDSRDAQKAVRDAETALETANLELEELLSPPDELTLFQAENSLVQANESKQKAEDDLIKSYDDGFNTVANAFLDLSTVMTGLQNVLVANTFKSDQWNIDYYADAAKQYDEKIIQYRNDAYGAYNFAHTAYDKNFSDYKAASRFSNTNVIESLINETYDTTKNIAEAIKNSNTLIQFYENKLTVNGLKPAALADTHLSNLNTYTGKTNSHLLSLFSAKNTIQNSKQAIVDAGQSIKEKELSLAKIKAGSDDLSIRAKKIAIQQKEDALLTAKQNLVDYYIYAPFGGLVAEMDVKKGDSISSASVVATLITKQKIAEIALNEVDVAKAKVGQKATLTFDAIEGLNITGEVVAIDTLGTVSQGVVTYNVKIGFDTQDERVKPGMSVAAAIIIEAKSDVLLVANAAVKSNGEQYVEILENNVPRSQTVEVGLSNDTMTEITSGLKEGDKVVTQTITGNTTNTTTQSNSQNRSGGFRVPGL